MINYNLAGKALLHCLKVSSASLLLVDEDPALRARIEEVQGTIESQLGMKARIMDSRTGKEVRGLTAERPPDSIREGVRGDWPMVLFYTRYRFVSLFTSGNPNQMQWHNRNAQRCSFQYR